SYTYTTQNPVVPINGGLSQYILVCLTINTATGCTSTMCDSIMPTPAVTGCNASYSYYSNYLNPLNYTFTDQSTAASAITSWSWTFVGGTPATSALQNPVVTFNTYGFHQVCLTITTDSCTDTYCNDIYVFDSLNSNCINYVTANIQNVSVIGGNDGAIDITVVGGTPPYTFIWSNGQTTEDLTGLTSGNYTVNILSADSLCPAYSFTATILEPYDSSLIIDTLWVPAIDTCLNFAPDSFFIANYVVVGNTVTITWVFTGGGMTQTLNVTYTFVNYGGYVVLLTIDCGQFKGVQTTYMSYINLQAQGITELTQERGKLEVYPNPASDFVNLRIFSQNPSQLNISIMNANGQQVYTSTENCNAGEFTDAINVSQLPSGIYFVNAINKEGVLYTAKFIK
ncbi:MAG: T9SS type A sorting domain-containing protein, partial [Bacteroidota bacterium]